MKFERKEKDDYIQIEAIDNNEIVGFINYKFKRSGKVWLNNIVVNKEYRTKGIGSMLLKLFENDCIEHYIKVVEGKFYPHDEEGDVVKSFYEKHGYSIYKDGYDTEIYKCNLKMNELETKKTKNR